jgi:hypothetical protein
MFSKKQANAARLALAKILGKRFELYPSDVAKEIYAGNDPGEWGRGAVLTVYTENGVINPLDYDWGRGIDVWCEIDDELRAAGFDLYNEPVNHGVVNFYEI